MNAQDDWQVHILASSVAQVNPNHAGAGHARDPASCRSGPCPRPSLMQERAMPAIKLQRIGVSFLAAEAIVYF